MLTPEDESYLSMPFEDLQLQGGESASSNTQIIKEGLLEKQGHIRKNWKLRWFTLTSDGLLSYARPLADMSGPNENYIRGAIYLNGSVIETHPSSVLTIKTPHGKDFPLRSPRTCPGSLNDEWRPLIIEYSQLPFTPPTITMSAYTPPPPLGRKQKFTKADFLEQEEASLSVFSVKVQPVPEDLAGNGSYVITTRVILSSVASQECETSVTRTLTEFRNFRRELHAAYPQLMIPPVRRHDLQSFLQRLCCHPALRFAPEFHQFLNLLNSYQMRDKNDIFKERRNEQKSLGETLALTRGGRVFNRDQKFHFTDSVASKLSEMKSHAQNVSGIIDRARQHFVQAKKNDINALKTSELAQEAFHQLGTTNASLNVLSSQLAEVLKTVAKSTEVNIQQNDFDEGLTEYSQFVLPALINAIERRRSLILAYQIAIAKTNTEKQLLLDQIRNASSIYARIKSGPTLKTTDRLRAIKRSEVRVRECEKEVQTIRDQLESVSTQFADEVSHFPRWFYRDFKAMLLTNVEQQLRYHQECMEAWSGLLPKVQQLDVAALDDPFDNWWLSLPMPPATPPVTVTLPSIDVRHHPSYRQKNPSLDEAPNLTPRTSQHPHISELTKTNQDDASLSVSSSMIFTNTPSPSSSIMSSQMESSSSDSDSEYELDPAANLLHNPLCEEIQAPSATPAESVGELVDAFDAVQKSLESLAHVDLNHSLSADPQASPSLPPVLPSRHSSDHMTQLSLDQPLDPQPNALHPISDSTPTHVFPSSPPLSSSSASSLPSVGDEYSEPDSSASIPLIITSLSSPPLVISLSTNPPDPSMTEIPIGSDSPVVSVNLEPPALEDPSPIVPIASPPVSDQPVSEPHHDPNPALTSSSSDAIPDSTASAAAPAESASQPAATPSPSSSRKSRPASLLNSLPILGSIRKIPGAVPAFRARAIFPYASQQDYQLSFGAGQIFIIEGKHDGGWWSGVDIVTLERGYIPGSFVEPIP